MSLNDLLQNIQENEPKGMGDVHAQIRKFFRANPRPTDDQVHDFADEIGMHHEELERHIYMMLGDYIKKDSIQEEAALHEIFIDMGDLNSMKAGKQRDMQMMRLSIIAELDAANLYEYMAEITDNKIVSKVLRDVAKEEKVHAGEFETVLEKLDPEYEEAEKEGEKEVEDMIGEED